MYGNNLSIKSFDDDLWQALEKERGRQEQHIELIASENYASPRILEAQGSILTNKYAEGYPGKRYYGGCEFVDIAEQLAIDRAKELFKADYANVQPHSGASANAAVFLALLNAGDKILGMSLDHGGHLTHGSKVNFSGKIYESYSYGIDPETGEAVDVLYGHLPVEPTQSIGQSIELGEIIGKQGGTGSVQSYDGTIASIDFLAPASRGSGSMTPYSNYESLRERIASQFQ